MIIRWFSFFFWKWSISKRIRETKRDNFSMQTFSKKFPRIRASNISKRGGGRKEEAVVAPWLSSFRSFTGPVVADNILTSFKSNEVYTHTHRYIRTRNTGERGNTSRVPRTPMHISSRAHPSYTRASEEVLFCTFPTLPAHLPLRDNVSLRNWLWEKDVAPYTKFPSTFRSGSFETT